MKISEDPRRGALRGTGTGRGVHGFTCCMPSTPRVVGFNGTSLRVASITSTW